MIAASESTHIVSNRAKQIIEEIKEIITNNH